MELSSVWWLYILAGAFVLVEFGESQLLECAKCDKREPNQCGSDPDFCAGHDRCFRMKYKSPNGRMVEKAGCGYETKCGRKAGKMQMCQKKDKCEVTICCKDNLCNSPSPKETEPTKEYDEQKYIAILQKIKDEQILDSINFDDDQANLIADRLREDLLKICKAGRDSM